MFTRQIAGTLTRASSRMDEGEVTITTPDRDLMGDTINPMEMETATYLAGPAAVNFAHDHFTHLPVAKTFSLTKSPTGIRAQFRWRTDPFSREVKAAFDDGVLGASVEFIVPEGRPAPNRDGGFDFGRTILTGWAFTGNPANPRAVKLLKSMRDNLKAMDRDLFIEITDWSNTGGFAKADFRAANEDFFDVDTGMLNRMVAKQLREQLSLVISIACKAGVRQAFGSGADYVEITDWNSRRQW